MCSWGMEFVFWKREELYLYEYMALCDYVCAGSFQLSVVESFKHFTGNGIIMFLFPKTVTIHAYNVSSTSFLMGAGAVAQWVSPPPTVPASRMGGSSRGLSPGGHSG